MGNHPLVDGNERLGWLATVVFQDVDGVWPEAPDDDTYDLVIAVANGLRDIDAVAHALAR